MVTLDELIRDLERQLANPKLPKRPWIYGAGIIESRISKEWPLDAKTLARAAVNAAPELIAEIGRLRSAIRINGYRWGATDADIDAVLIPPARD